MFANDLKVFSSVQFSCSVVSVSLRPHESQHARPPCSAPSPGVHSDSCPSSPWCHPAISSSVIPFFSCLQSLPASESFPMSQLFAWGGQSTGVSALASFLPKKSSFKGLSSRLLGFKAVAKAEKTQLTYTVKAKETEGRREEWRQFQEGPLWSELLIFL